MLNVVYVVVVVLLICCKSQFTIASRRKGGLIASSDDEQVSWHGKWFPNNPYAPQQQTKKIQPCDDGLHGIDIDFTPLHLQANTQYLCITNNRTAFEPNLQTEPVLKEYYVPKAYQPVAKCLNESLSYNESIPTFGFYRPLAPKYGSYAYLPPQRWLHALAEGAIVLLYHPCANNGQRLILEKLVKSCLYRHIVSASTVLDAKRPFALIAWGRSLELSVVDENIVINFIQEYAKHGPLISDDNEQALHYEIALLEDAHLLTDLQDSEVCSFVERGM